MCKFNIVANIKAAPGKIDLVKAKLEKLIPITHAEADCIQYGLHQDNDNPANFMFYENWGSRELWQVHMSAQHHSDYMSATEGAVADFMLNEMTHVS